MDFKIVFTAAATILFFVCYIKETTGSKSSFICLPKCRCSGIQDTFVVDCSNTGLESVPKGIPSRTTNLFLNNNKIRVLLNDSFSQSKGRLPNLIKLSIRSNKLRKIEINALRGLVNLKMLDLYDNNLQFKDSYPKSVFVPISQSLKVLDIRRNLLGDIDEMNYPASVGEVLGLGELRIDCLRNRSLPMEYGKLKNLAKISFSDGRKQVRFVGDDMFKAVSALGITDIDFAGLDIAVIGNNTFLNLPRLKILDLSNNYMVGNHIKNIIPSLKNTSIETLKLNNTGMGQMGLPDLMTTLKKLGDLHLKQLTIDNNMLTTLDPIFSDHFPDLEVLSLGCNFLADALSLRYDILKMKHLIGLNVSWQQKYTKQPPFMTLSVLGPILNASSLPVPVDVICLPGMACPLTLPPKLQWIDLSHSNYGTIRLPELVLLQNTTLKSFDVSYNGIHFIEKPMYCVKTVVPQIETMNFNDNALKCVNSSFLRHCNWSSMKRVFFKK